MKTYLDNPTERALRALYDEGKKVRYNSAQIWVEDDPTVPLYQFEKNWYYLMLSDQTAYPIY